jgi:arylsulfatase
MSVNGEQVAQGRIPHTQAIIFSADETADVGIDLGTPVVEAIGAEQKPRFNGHISKVTVEVRDVDRKAEAAVSDGQAEVARRTQ